MEEEGGFDYRWVYGLDKLSVKITSEGTNWWGQNVKQDILKDYLHQDRLGSTTNLTDKFGRVVGRADYNEWGEITYKDALDITSAYRRIYPQLNYTGHDWDDVLEMYYAKARFYDPDAKRFVEIDPVKGQVTDPLSLVSYLYCVDNPLRWVDPLGLAYEGNGSNKATTYIVTKDTEWRFNPVPMSSTKPLKKGTVVTDGGRGVTNVAGKELRWVFSKTEKGWVNTQYLKPVSNTNANKPNKQPSPKPVIDVQKLTNSENKHIQNQSAAGPDHRKTLNEAKQDAVTYFPPYGCPNNYIEIYPDNITAMVITAIDDLIQRTDAIITTEEEYHRRLEEEKREREEFFCSALYTVRGEEEKELEQKEMPAEIAEMVPSLEDVMKYSSGIRPLNSSLKKAKKFIQYGEVPEHASARVDIQVTTEKAEEEGELWFDTIASGISTFHPIVGVIYAAAKDSPKETVAAGASFVGDVAIKQKFPDLGPASMLLGAVDTGVLMVKAFQGSSNPNYRVFISAHSDDDAIYGTYIFDPEGNLIDSDLGREHIPYSPYYRHRNGCENWLDVNLGGGIDGKWPIEQIFRTK